MVDHIADAVDHLGQVMRRDVGRHADRDARRAVYQKVGETGGEHERLLPLLVEVRAEIHCVFLNIRQHMIGDPGHAGFGVTVGRRGVAVHRAKVAVAIDQRIVQGKRLRQAHQRVVYRSVAVRMIAAEHVTDRGRGLAVGLVRGQAVLIHRVQDAAVDRLEAVAHVGQRAADDHAHRVIDIALAHLLFQVHL